MKTTTLLSVVPVLPSMDIERDLKWYQEQTGFKKVFANKMYAVLERAGIYIHLQWHADTEDDPLLGGSVIRFGVDHIEPIFDEFVKRGTVSRDKLVLSTPWETNEFGFYDLNSNAIFFAQDIRKQ